MQTTTQDDLISFSDAAQMLGIGTSPLEQCIGNSLHSPVPIVVREGLPVRTLKHPGSDFSQMRWELFTNGNGTYSKTTPYTDWVESGRKSVCPESFDGYELDDVIEVAEAEEITGIPWRRAFRVNGGRQKASPLYYVSTETRRYITYENLVKLAHMRRPDSLADILIRLRVKVQETDALDGQADFARFVNDAVSERRKGRASPFGRSNRDTFVVGR